jgi:hypothetical protein
VTKRKPATVPVALGDLRVITLRNELLEIELREALRENAHLKQLLSAGEKVHHA